MRSESQWLALLLDAPLQSWGFESRFERRTTWQMPTFSGIIGLLGAALGLDKTQPGEQAVVERLAELEMVAIAFPQAKRKGRQPISPPPLEDFHTVGGGFDKRCDPERVPRKAEGGPRDHPVPSRRFYLQGSRFGVLLSAREGWQLQMPGQSSGGLSLLASALRDPKWGLWLGRKACVPAEPLLVVSKEVPDGLFATEADAFRALALRAGLNETNRLEHFLHERSGTASATGDESFVLNDVPVAFGAPIGQRHVSRQVVRRHPTQPPPLR